MEGRKVSKQRAKNPVSASALLTGKFLRVRIVFARFIYNASLKGPHLSTQGTQYPGKIEGFKLFVSGQYRYCPVSFNTVQTVSILSGRCQYCLDGFNTVRTVLILSGRS